MLGRVVSPLLALALISGFVRPAGAARQPPLECGNLELSIREARQARTIGDRTAYDRLLRGHAYEFVDGEPIDRTQPQSDDIVASMKRYVSATPRPTIVIHFHGGLVDRCSGYTGAASLVQAYAAVGAFAIFPIYNVGTGESIDKGWSGLSARDPQYGGDGRAMSVSRRFWYGEGLLADPVTDVRSLAVWNRWHQKVAEGDRRFAAERTHDDVITGRALTLREEELRLGLTPGISEGYNTGGRAWSYMKFVIDRSLAIDTQRQSDRNSGAMLALMDEIHAQTALKPISIVLVGHSTGAIFAAKFLRAWKSRARDVWQDKGAEHQRFTMLFMAPALRYDVLDQALDEAGDMLQGRFRTFTMYDGAERDSYDGPFPGVRQRYYRLALLYAISGIFEPWPDAPIFGMQRFACPPFGKTPYSLTLPATPQHPYAFGTEVTHLEKPDLEYVHRVLKWFDDNQVVHPFAFSPSPLGTPVGMATTSIEHGDFPRDFATMSSVAALSTAGWSAPAGPWTVPATNGDCSEMLSAARRPL